MVNTFLHYCWEASSETTTTTTTTPTEAQTTTTPSGRTIRLIDNNSIENLPKKASEPKKPRFTLPTVSCDTLIIWLRESVISDYTDE